MLFVDVSGSTRLYETAGDAAAHAAIDKCIGIFRSKTQESGGRVVKTIGDEVMAVFDDAGPAADAAVEMQLAIQEEAPVGDATLGVRIGFHHGTVVEREGDVFGDTVNIAARLSALASKGQIMTSRETIERLTAAQRRLSRRLYSISVKGRTQEIDLYEILWQESEEQTTLASQRSMLQSRKSRLRLKYLEAEMLLEGGMPSLTLGRDKKAGLTIVDKMASRSHAKIECRLGRFVLGDHSANGTYVTFEDEPELVLRREEVILRGRGFIAFGQPRASASEVAEFSCE
ncbi:MAG: adenylate/guanylate cyclase domain-containing protein [Burkholderiales bacterium]|nr:adenylate/guanylate cyclase domain-containing protein [Burkholderiales bacterium]